MEKNGHRYLSGEDLPGDFVTDFFQFASCTQDDRSPEIYRRWCGIALLAGALERRVTVRTGMNITHCNLYTLLVGPSGTGKYIIKTVKDFWRGVKDPSTTARMFHVAPDSLTKASLVDRLERSKQNKLSPEGMVEYHSLLIGAEEFSVLLPGYDFEYIGTLNSIYNNPPDHIEERRYGKTSTVISNPCLNILGGVQPHFLGNVFPEEVWMTGLARRTLMIFSDEIRIQDPFTEYPDPVELRERIFRKLSLLGKMWGEISWEGEAREFFRAWVMAGEPEVPSHSRLQGYVRERRRNVMKLSGISSISRKLDLSPIERIDVERALEWMFEAERAMPAIFRAMLAKSEWAVVEELYNEVIKLWRTSGRKPIPGRKIYEFVGERVAVEKVERVIALAIRTKAIRQVRQDVDLWEPAAKVFKGEEGVAE